VKKLSIWFLNAHEPPKGHTSRTYDYALGLIRRGHRVTVFTNSYCHRTHVERLAPGEKWRVEDIEGIRVVWLRTFHYKGNSWRRGFNMLSYPLRAMEAARALGDTPDAVFGDSVPPTAGWTAARVAHRFKAAFIFQIRDVWPIALVYDGGLARHSPIYYGFRYIEKSNYRKAHQICATMPFLKQHVAASGGDPEKVTWIPNGVNLRSYPKTAPYDGGVGKKDLLFLYAGAFGNAHDVITIVRAAHLLQQRGVQGVQFRFVGDGVKKQECINEVSRLGLDNVTFGETLPKDQIPELQNQADLLIACVTNSRAYEFGLNLNKLYDYFASGRPVLFSGTAPNDPVAESGAGFSIPPENPAAMADAFEAYLQMPAPARAELGQKARSYAEVHFDVEKLIDRMETMIQKAVSNNQQEPSI